MNKTHRHQLYVWPLLLVQTHLPVSRRVLHVYGVLRMVVRTKPVWRCCVKSDRLIASLISYLHAEALAAGELKHGTLALIEDGTPIIVTASQNHLLDKTTSNVQEVIARGAYVIAIGDNQSEKLENISDEYVTLPDSNEILTTVISIIPLQFIAYHVAYLNGESIDQPRNLAKSVTVE